MTRHSWYGIFSPQVAVLSQHEELKRHVHIPFDIMNLISLMNEW